MSGCRNILCLKTGVFITKLQWYNYIVILFVINCRILISAVSVFAFLYAINLKTHKNTPYEKPPLFNILYDFRNNLLPKL